MKLRPVQDRTGKLYTGQGQQGYFETLSREEKDKLPYIVTSETTVVVSDGKVLNMKDPVDKENARWVINHPYIGKDFEAAASSKDVVFYIEDRKKEATKRVTASKTKDKARYIVQFELPLDKLKYVCKVLGNLSADSFTELELQDWLLQLTETAPEAVLAAADPKNTDESDAKIKFNELERWKIIVKYRGGVWRFGGPEGLYLGHTPEQVLEFLSKPDNQETVAAIMVDLNSKRGKA